MRHLDVRHLVFRDQNLQGVVHRYLVVDDKDHFHRRQVRRQIFRHLVLDAKDHRVVDQDVEDVQQIQVLQNQDEDLSLVHDQVGHPFYFHRDDFHRVVVDAAFRLMFQRDYFQGVRHQVADHQVEVHQVEVHQVSVIVAVKFVVVDYLALVVAHRGVVMEEHQRDCFQGVHCSDVGELQKEESAVASPLELLLQVEQE